MPLTTRVLLMAVAPIVCAFPVLAAPVSFHFNLTIGDNDSGTPHPIFTGAQLDVTVSIDTASLAPIADTSQINQYTWHTQWPSSNAIATVKLTGTAAHDGVYPATVATAFPFDMYDNDSFGKYDRIGFPPITMETGSGGIGLSGLQATLPNTYFQPGNSTLHPHPFSANEAKWSGVTIGTSNPFMRCGAAGGVTGFATAVPEPSAAAFVSGVIACLAALRRRK